jgi:hypothetical protein
MSVDAATCLQRQHVLFRAWDGLDQRRVEDVLALLTPTARWATKRRS